MATMKQRQVFEKVVNGSKITKAMQEVGYSKSTSLRTNKVTHTKGWVELMENTLSDNALLKKHKQLLEKQEKIVVSDGAREGSHIEDTGQPHSDAVKALDIAYKLKKRYGENGSNTQINIGIIGVDITVRKNGDQGE